jgi:hypothetical protein
MGLIATFVIVSCKKNDLSKNESAENASASSSANGILLNSVPAVPLPDCDVKCIDPEGPYVEATDFYTHYYGNHSKTVSYVAYNTPTSFVVKVTFVHSGGNASDIVSVTTPLGSPQSVLTLASGATAIFTFALPAGWEKCANVPFTIRQEGQGAPINMSATYNLYGICADRGCETSFTGEVIGCDPQREALYTFTSKDEQTYFKIQGGLTNFTGIEDADVEVLGGTNIIETQGGPGGSTNHIIKVEGSIGACETITIRIRWNSTNSGGVITGSWSVKDGNGIELAPVVEGLTCGN